MDRWYSEDEEAPEPTAQRRVLVGLTGEPVVLSDVRAGDVQPATAVLQVGGERVMVGPRVGEGLGTSEAWVWRRGAWVPLTTEDLGGRVLAAGAGGDGRVVVEVRTDDPLIDAHGVLWSVDVATGEAVQLTQEPPDDPTLRPFGSTDFVPASG